ncbi:MAG: DinB family protein [Terriglobia bacterium]
MRKCKLCGEVHAFSRRQAFRIQAATPAKLKRLLRGLNARHLRRRPAPRTWSLQEIAVHLFDVELAFGFRYRKILAEPGALITPFDQNRWARELDYRRQNLRAVLDAFAALRKAHLALLARIPAKQWRRAARHPEYRGRYVLEPAFIHLAAHDRNHLSQIRALRRRWRAP